MDDFSLIITGVTIAVFATFVTYISSYISNTTSKNDKLEIQKDFQDIKIILKNEKINVIDLMLKNVSELREYYVISKNQATRSFTIAIIMSILGVAIYMFGIISVIYFKQDVKTITIISGTVVEVVSAMPYWLYSQSIKQLNIYHNRLTSSEKYLTAMQLIEMLPEEKKYDEYRNIINYILNDNQEQIKKMLSN